MSGSSCGSGPRCTFILCAVCQVRMMTSPTRPMAWLSEDIIESAPRSCRMSSAAIVSLRMRLSAKARSSGIAGRGGGTPSACRDARRWCSSCRAASGWSRRAGCSEARDLDDVRRVAAAGALGVEGVDGAALEGRDVSRRSRIVQRVGVDHDLHVEAVRDGEAESIAAGVVPQSSCSFSAQAPADHLHERGRMRGVALAEKPRFTGKDRGRRIISRCQARACRWSRWCRWPGLCRRRASRSRPRSAPRRSAAGR